MCRHHAEPAASLGTSSLLKSIERQRFQFPKLLSIQNDTVTIPHICVVNIGSEGVSENTLRSPLIARSHMHSTQLKET